MKVAGISRIGVVVVVFCLLSLSPRPVAADIGQGFANALGGAIAERMADQILGGMILAGTAEGILVASCLLTTGVSAHYGSKGEQAPAGWLIGGYAAGGLNVAAGGVLLVATEGEPMWMAMGVFQMVLGALDLGLTAWTHSKPKKERRISLRPLMIPDARGKPAVGLGLLVVR